MTNFFTNTSHINTIYLFIDLFFGKIYENLDLAMLMNTHVRGGGRGCWSACPFAP